MPPQIQERSKLKSPSHRKPLFPYTNIASTNLRKLHFSVTVSYQLHQDTYIDVCLSPLLIRHGKSLYKESEEVVPLHRCLSSHQGCHDYQRKCYSHIIEIPQVNWCKCMWWDKLSTNESQRCHYLHQAGACFKEKCFVLKTTMEKERKANLACSHLSQMEASVTLMGESNSWLTSGSSTNKCKKHFQMKDLWQSWHEMQKVTIPPHDL